MAWILIVHIVHTLNSSVWNSQEESRMENKSYFFGGNITFFAIPFCGIGESISGWMTIACMINNFCEVEFANVFMADGVWGGISTEAPCIRLLLFLDWYGKVPGK